MRKAWGAEKKHEELKQTEYEEPQESLPNLWN